MRGGRRRIDGGNKGLDGVGLGLLDGKGRRTAICEPWFGIKAAGILESKVPHLDLTAYMSYAGRAVELKRAYGDRGPATCLHFGAV